MDVRARAALKPVDPYLAIELKSILKRLMARKTAKEFFNKPVEWKKLNLWNYRMVVRKPMDLATIQQKLEQDADKEVDAKSYQYIEDFAADVRLVWKNAILFNGPQWNAEKGVMVVAFAEAFKAARELGRAFEEMMCELHAKLDSEAPLTPLLWRCQLILSDVMRNPASEWFRQSVHWESLGEVYSDKIVEPMDLGLIQTWLDSQNEDDLHTDEQRKQMIEEFNRRLNLVHSNAVEFNGEVSAHGALAKMLLLQIQFRIRLLRELQFPPPRPKALANREGWPTFHDKAEFYELCNDLSQYDQSQLVSLLKRACPDCITEDEGDVAYVNVDAIDSKAFESASSLGKDLQQRAFLASMQDDELVLY